MAIGASFSALEVVPLIVLGYEGYEHWSMQRHAKWMERLKGRAVLCCRGILDMLGAGGLALWFNPPIL